MDTNPSIPFTPQVPSMVAIAAVIVYFINGSLGGNVTTDQVSLAIQAGAEIVFVVSSIWQWLQTRGMLRQNAALQASLTAALTPKAVTAPKVAKKKVSKK